MNTRTLSKLVETCFELIHLPETTNKHFSFLLLRNTPICMGFSKLRSDPLAKKHNYKWEATHSELDCFKKCPLSPDQFYKLTLVNIRVNTKHLIQNSKPCNPCNVFLNKFAFRSIYFTTSDGDFSCL